jgi:predicted ATPase
MFLGRARATWIQLDPLTYSSVASMVSRTLRQSKDNIAPLARLIHGISAGNAFSIRNLLTTLQRQHLVSSERAAALALAELQGRSRLIGIVTVGSQFWLCFPFRNQH